MRTMAFSIRMPAHLARGIDQVARSEHRSRAQQIAFYVERCLRADGVLEPEGERNEAHAEPTSNAS